MPLERRGHPLTAAGATFVFLIPAHLKAPFYSKHII